MNAIQAILSDDLVQVEDHGHGPHLQVAEFLEPGLDRESGQPLSVGPDHPRELNSAGAHFDPPRIAFPVVSSDADPPETWSEATQLDVWPHRPWPGWEADNNYRLLPMARP